MYNVLYKNTIVMFLDVEDRDEFVRCNVGAIILNNLNDTDGNLPVVLYSCLNCTYCVADDSVLSRSISCCINNMKVIAWSGMGDSSYFHILEKCVSNPHYVSNHCTDFLPREDSIYR